MHVFVFRRLDPLLKMLSLLLLQLVFIGGTWAHETISSAKFDSSMDISVSGTVTDTNEVPLPGVTVTVLGTNRGTVTNLDGRYSITVPDNAELVFSFIGFTSQTIQVGNQSTIDVVLAEDLASLDEVVVVGYGTQKKANMTGSVATVGADEIIKRPLTNVAGLLQGKVAGLQVSSHS